MLKLQKKNKLVLNNRYIKNLLSYIYKLILSDLQLSDIIDREKIRKFYSKFNRYSSLTRFRKTCYLTNRARGNYSLFNLSRFKIKFLAWEGLLVGLKRATW